MKTERRHELQTNVLASSLAQGVERAKPYGRGVLAAILAAVCILVAWMYIASQNASQSALAWDEYLQAVNTRDEQLLQDIAEQNAGSMVANWARLTRADWQLEAGTGRLMTDRAAATEQLREASETFRALQSTSNTTIKQRATFGAARAFEAMGELDKAREEYNKLATDYPDSPFAGVAKSRASDLEKLSTKEFYDWLAKYEPPKALSGEPGTPGARPDFLKEPDVGTLSVPSSLAEPGASFPSFGTEPASDAPATEGAAPEGAPAAAADSGAEATPPAETPQ